MKFKLLLRLICLTMGLMVCGTLHATTFIKADFCYSWDDNYDWATGKVWELGYTRLDYDFNNDCGKTSGYIYLGYKTTTNPAEACTDIMFLTTTSNPPATKVYNGKTYKLLNQGWCGGKNTTKWDFNSNAGGDYVFMYYTSDGNTSEGASLVTSLGGTTDGNTSNLAQSFDGGAANLNGGTGHKALYLVVNKGHKHQGSTYSKNNDNVHHRKCSCGLTLPDENHDNQYTGGKCSKCGFQPLKDALCFTSKQSGSTVKLTKTSSVNLQYTTSDGYSWKDFTNGQTITLNSGSKLYVHATSTNGTLNGCQFTIYGNVEASGELNTLINRENTKNVPYYGFYALFKGCTGLTKAPTLSGTTLGESCYESLFEGCTGLTSAPTLGATKMSKACYKNMFKGCSKLTSAPELPATTLAESCYENMFRSTAITTAPQLKATSLSNRCYYEMFDDCKNLTSAPALPATTLTSYCYNGMFRDCSSLKTAPTISAQYMAERACSAMFERTGLTSAPALNATSMASYCYAWMFKDCKALTSAPELPATTLSTSCYEQMFWGCEALKQAPYLPATTLQTTCYKEMFRYSKNLNFVSVAFNYWSNGCTTDWLNGVAEYGVLVSPTTLSTSSRGTSTIPSKWVANPNFLCFTAQENGATVQLKKSGSPNSIALKYSTDRYKWNDVVVGSTKVTLNKGQKVYFKAADTNSTFSDGLANYYYFVTNDSKKIAASGNVMSLLDQCCILTSVPNDAFLSLFEGNMALISAPELPATQVGVRCYKRMFVDCKNLTDAPALPATTMSKECYSGMFINCLALKKAPALPATTLAKYCYENMFSGCYSLTQASTLPATTLAEDCYSYMFVDCTSLTTAPELPATQLANNCYTCMFLSCSSLNFVAVNFTQWKDDATTNWLKDVSKEGLFLCPDELEQKRGASNIPTDWGVNPDYLCFTAEEANSSVLLKKDGEQESIGLEYSSDRIHWNDFIVGTTKVVLSTVGEKFYLRAKGENETLSKSTSDCYRFKMEGKVAASGNLMSLLDAKMTRQDVPDYAFAQLFWDCEALTKAPKLPATKVGKSAYHFMFERCENLTSAPALPATELGEMCYMNMFKGCKNLTDAPALPATTLAKKCYSSMFMSCLALKKAPALPATTLADDCYANMFNECTSLTEAPALPATQLTKSCYFYMFNRCEALTTAPQLPATQLAENCYYGMFANCTSLTTAPALPATQLADYCYDCMFQNCTSLKSVSVAFTDWEESAALPTDNWLKGVSKEGVFLCPNELEQKRGTDYIPEGWVVNPDYLCFTAKKANSSVSMDKYGNPDAIALEYSADRYTWKELLPGSTKVALNNVGDKVYLRAKDKNETFSKSPSNRYSFDLRGEVAASGNVMSLLDASLKRKDVPKSAFELLFDNCSALTSAPELPAETLSEDCYADMFNGCDALKTAPELPATKMEPSCYARMFMYCTSLTAAPKLPATQLANHCYYNMFYECTALTSAPQLPATQLAQSCYYSMFEGCTSLVEAPYLPATQLSGDCYGNMFEGCTSLNFVSVAFTEWKDYATYEWLKGVSEEGMFLCPSELEVKRGDGFIPENWQVNPDYLCFTAEKANSRVALAKTGTPGAVALEYSTDRRAWSDFVAGTTTMNLSHVGDKAYLRVKGKNQSFSTDQDSYYTFSMEGKVAASGNVMSLLDASMKQTSVTWSEFYGLFRDCAALTSAPSLPATQLADGCYGSIFEGCTSLTQAPALPATQLAGGCYNSMFEGCTSLTEAPALPATQLTPACYSHMFRGCTSLTKAPALPATELKSNCYHSMFDGCTSLTQAPALPATQMARLCYINMFGGCTSLTEAPALPATQLAEYCYSDMFDGCTSLTEAPALPATQLENYCYQGMFRGCTSLACVTVAFTEWKESSTREWLENVCEEGLFLCPDALEKRYDDNHIPEGWQVNLDYLCFTAEEENSRIALCKNKSMKVAAVPVADAVEPASWEVSTDHLNWRDYRLGDGIEMSQPGDAVIELPHVGDKVYFRAKSIRKTVDAHFEMEGKIAASGNVMSLLDKTLKGTTVEEYAFADLFTYNAALTTAPELPATKLLQGAYYGMFANCTSLQKAPALPAKELGEGCYSCMFSDCTSLTEAPALAATTLAEYCYNSMFGGCTSLTEAPALPATQLADYCYQGMFQGCTSLTKAPVLPATQLENGCYCDMFTGCTSLNEVNVAFTEWNVSATEDWLANVAKEGTFYCPAILGWNWGNSYVPLGWEVPSHADYLCFTAREKGSFVALSTRVNIGTGDNPINLLSAKEEIRLEYSTDGWHWNEYPLEDKNVSRAISLSEVGDKVMFRAADKNRTLFGYHFNVHGKVAASGNTMSLLDRKMQQTNVPDSAFACLFVANADLTTAPELPAEEVGKLSYAGMFANCMGLQYGTELRATELGDSCYMMMYAGCSKLYKAYEPKHGDVCSAPMRAKSNKQVKTGLHTELPATELAPGCYLGMFTSCSSLVEFPELPAETMAENCYAYMFAGCTTVEELPALNATTLADGCYASMFDGCKAMRGDIYLPAETLADHCYERMFAGSRVQECILPATELTESCYREMFQGCDELMILTVAFTGWHDELNATQNWLEGAGYDKNESPLEGMNHWQFICPAELAQEEGRLPEYFEYNSYTTKVKLNASGYATYSSPVWQTVEEGAKIAACEITPEAIVLHELPFITDGDEVFWGYLLVGEPNAEVTFHTLLNPEDIQDLVSDPAYDDLAMVRNNLHATTIATAAVIPMEFVSYMGALLKKDIDVYALKGSKFLKYVGSSFVHGKAYLANYTIQDVMEAIEELEDDRHDDDDEDEPRYQAVENRRIVWDYELEEETNGITQIRTQHDAPAYNLNGQRSFLNRGLQIRNGKVVLNK